MTDFLTQRTGTWHFGRRVPKAYAELDARGIVRHSTRIRVAEDRLGRRAARVADRLNAELELFWRELADGQSQFTLVRYDEARKKARALGFEYIPHEQLITLPAEKLLERLEALVAKGVAGEPATRAALLGTEGASASTTSGRHHRLRQARCLIPGFDGAFFTSEWRDVVQGQVLHGRATTTEAIRRAIQHSQASLKAHSKRYGINSKTVARCRPSHGSKLAVNLNP